MGDERYYDIELKQGDLTINLLSDDVYFISRQMDKWFKVLMDDSYTPIQIPPSGAVNRPAPFPEPTPVQPVAPVQQELPSPPQQQTQTSEPEPAPLPLAAAPALTPPSISHIEPTPLPPLPPSLTPVQHAPPTPIPELQGVTRRPAEPHESPVLDQNIQNDFEAVMDTLMRDLEKGEGSPSPYQPAGKFATSDYGREDNTPDPLDFSDVANLNQLADRSKASTSEDFLLLTGFYLNDFESAERFSLKRVNSQLVKSGLTPVNHSVLESTITKGYLSLIPDMTGMADVSEYSLSESGRQYALRLFV